jgi:hypothetical protein
MATLAQEKMDLINKIQEEFYKKYGVIKNERMFSSKGVFLFDFTLLGQQTLIELDSDMNKYIAKLCAIDKKYTNIKTFNSKSSIANNTHFLEVVLRRVQDRIRTETAAWDEAEMVLFQKNLNARIAYEKEERAAGRQIMLGGYIKRPDLWPGPGSVHPSLSGGADAPASSSSSASSAAAGAEGGSGKKRKTRSRKNKRSRRRSTRKF